MTRRAVSSRIALAAALGLTPTMAPAQGWGDYLAILSPERLIQQVVQMGVMALRSQVDLKYGDMAVNPLTGYITVTDVQMWPLPDWDENAECQVSADRLTIRTAAVDEPDRIRLKLQLSGVEADSVCLPPDGQQGFAMTGLERINVPRLTADVDYTISSAEADLRLRGAIAGLAGFDLAADLSYFAFEDSGSEPYPVIFLSGATLKIENLGGWDVAKGMLPPPFTDPNQAPLVVEGMLGQALGQMNAEAASDQGAGDASALSPAQMAFVQSVKTAWPAFLANPNQLVLETGLDAGEDVYVDLEFYEDSPQALFDDLRPVVSRIAASQRDVLPLSLLQAASGGAGLTPEDQRKLGFALMSGQGAPRNASMGIALLTPLAEGNDGEAAMAIAREYAATDPVQAYRFAMAAGQEAMAGAAGLLDRLESKLSFAQVLSLQAAVSTSAAPQADQDLAALRDMAIALFSGSGQGRSYEQAAVFAMLASAAGDAESADILDEIAARARAKGDDGLTAWKEVEARASAKAMEIWMSGDFPSRLSSAD